MDRVFTVVGEHCEDPNHLLVLGTDGQYYDHQLSDGRTVPVEPDERWVLDPATRPDATAVSVDAASG